MFVGHEFPPVTDEQ